MLKEGSNDQCGYEQITTVGNKGVNNYSYALDGTHKIGIILPEWNNGKYNHYNLRIRTVSNDYNEIQVYNFDNSTIRTFFVKNGTNDFNIKNVHFASGEYVMFDCITCSPTSNEVYIQQETLGQQQEIIYYNHQIQNYEETNNLYVYLYGAKKCYTIVKQFFWLWVGLLFFILLIIGLNKGYEETAETVLKWD